MPERIYTLRPIRPNKGIEMAYRKKLMKLIDEMQNSVKYWIEAEYKRQEPVIMADDATPADAMARALRKRFTQWQRNFRREARKLAEWFARSNYRYVDNAFKDSIRSYRSEKFQQKLNEVGFTIDLKMTPAVENVLKSFIHANVNYIHSIPQQYFTDVEGMVMRAVRSGRDLEYLSGELEKYYTTKGKDRAVRLARDQTNKATSQLAIARQRELGITHAIWKHAGGVKSPRHSHEAADGKIFSLKDGLIIPGEAGYGGKVGIFPGEAINCHCYARPIIKEFM